MILLIPSPIFTFQFNYFYIYNSFFFFYTFLGLAFYEYSFCLFPKLFQHMKKKVAIKKKKIIKLQNFAASGRTFLNVIFFFLHSFKPGIL